MPLSRADIRHRLYDTILRLEIRAQCGGEISDLMKTYKQLLSTGSASIQTRLGVLFINSGSDDRAQTIPPSCSSSSLRASSI